MIINNRIIIILFVFFFKINVFSQKTTNSDLLQSNELYKKIWQKEEAFFPIDTTKNIVVFNPFYNINPMFCMTTRLGEYSHRKFEYTKDTIYYKLINKNNLIFHVKIIDSLNRIIEEGDLKGIGPFVIVQDIFSFDSIYTYDYKYYYYLLEIGEWKLFDNKKKQYYLKKKEMPSKINIDYYTKKDIHKVVKIRKKYLKTNNLNKNYFE